MKSIGGVVLAVVILLAMVTIHEFGHYLAGKALNFKINEFSVGFGPALFKKRNKKTGELFALRLIPLGGYCAFEGEDDTEDAGAKKETADGAEPEREPFSDFSQTTQADGVTKSAAPAERESAEVYPEAKGENFNESAALNAYHCFDCGRDDELSACAGIDYRHVYLRGTAVIYDDVCASEGARLADDGGSDGVRPV